ncbi:hypothetical protein HY990_02955 [Candidatus Micrarchaeota archaeon]|nr:hypothetical protein [Candidatus Micrarchaeota archaeon]
MKLQIIAFLIIGLLIFGCAQSNNDTQKISNKSSRTATSLKQCEDSDGGLDENANGFAIDNRQKATDSCVNESVVAEGYCTREDKVAVQEISCDRGKICQNGACVAVANVQNQTTVQPITEAGCSETDNGNNIYQSGTVRVQNRIYSDVCQGAYDILEYYCQNGEQKQANLHCPTGSRCLNGACTELERTCSETDANDQDSYGQTTIYGGGIVVNRESDRCLDGLSNLEFYCDGTQMSNRTVNCGTGKYCSSGMCQNICTDYDQGQNQQNVNSYVRVRNETYNDLCQDQKTLLEWSCDGTTPTNRQITCDGACNNGRCINRNELTCINEGSVAQLIYDGKIIEQRTSSCADSRTLRQVSCIDGEFITDALRCTSGDICSSSDCITPTPNSCYDLDSGSRDAYSQSSVIRINREGVKSEQTDDCLSDSTVIEYSCDQQNVKVDYKTCPSGYSCRYGACRAI